MTFPIRVADLMTRPPHTVAPDATAAEAAARCIEADVGSLVVVSDGEPVGIVTTTDFVRTLGETPDPGERPVEAFMSAPLCTVAPDATVGEAVEAMSEAGVSRLVVVDGEELVGALSTEDLLRHVPQVLHRIQFGDSPGREHRYRARQETAYEADDWEFECFCRSDDAVSVGDRVTFSKTLSEEDVRAFADASGDTNRLHLDEAYAAGTRFGGRIVHGTLVGGLVSAALARLPGLTIYLSQDLSFLAPVEIGERATAVCEVVESFGRDKYEVTTDVYGEDGEQVIEGEAAVLIDAPPDPEAVAFEAIP
ncbi:MAG: CBS domain-containing protein [Haloarculaceae archaeon]